MAKWIWSQDKKTALLISETAQFNIHRIGDEDNQFCVMAYGKNQTQFKLFEGTESECVSYIEKSIADYMEDDPVQRVMSVFNSAVLPFLFNQDKGHC